MQSITIFLCLMLAQVSFSSTLTDYLDAKKESLESEDLSQYIITGQNSDFWGKKLNIDIERPNSCPLKSLSDLDLLENIQSIYKKFGDACRSDVSIDFGELGAELQTTGVTNSVQKEALLATSVMDSLNKILNTKSCIKDMEDGSLLLSIANTIQNISLLGLTSESKEVFAAGGIGIGISSLIKIIHRVFSRPFNFDKSIEQRKSFLELNCAFYNVRAQITSKGILEENSQDLQGNYNRFKGHLEKIQKKLNLLSQEQEGFKKSFQALKEKKLEALYSVEKLKNYKLLNEAMEKVKPIEKVEGNGQQLQKLASVSFIKGNKEKITNLIQNFEQSETIFAPLVIELLENKFSDANYYELVPMTVEDYNLKVLNILYFSLSAVQKKFKAEYDENVSELEVETSRKYLAIIDLYKNIQTKIIDFKGLLDSRVAYLEKTLSKSYLNENNDGDFNKKEIMEFKEKISIIIFPLLGNEYIDHFVKTSDESLDSFVKAYNRTQRDYEFYKYVSDKFSRVRLCQNLAKINEWWHHSIYSVEVGFDYLASNMDVFNDFTVEESGLFKNKNARKVLNHLRSAQLEKARIASETFNKNEYEDLVKKSSGYYVKNIGSMARRIQDLKPHKAALERLYQVNNCHKVFNL